MFMLLWPPLEIRTYLRYLKIFILAKLCRRILSFKTEILLDQPPPPSTAQSLAHAIIHLSASISLEHQTIGICNNKNHIIHIMPSLKCIRFRCLDKCMASLFGVFLKGDVAAKITDPAKFLNWSWFFWLTPNLQSTVLARPGLHLRYGV